MVAGRMRGNALVLQVVIESGDGTAGSPHLKGSDFLKIFAFAVDLRPGQAIDGLVGENRSTMNVGLDSPVGDVKILPGRNVIHVFVLKLRDQAKGNWKTGQPEAFGTGYFYSNNSGR